MSFVHCFPVACHAPSGYETLKFGKLCCWFAALLSGISILAGDDGRCRVTGLRVCDGCGSKAARKMRGGAEKHQTKAAKGKETPQGRKGGEKNAEKKPGGCWFESSA
ncbi:hypothetical protein TSUD_323920 [Trifolium subterraneum]|uniref:Uncharacterized protein n=1 Tax=Trifolium subterraneum TaxID=3900 RepID=A0A2Z6NH63_TRISU|nr:hypothetical protein TSUD_323920 [Trifolium subterraneum]